MYNTTGSSGVGIGGGLSQNSGGAGFAGGQSGGLMGSTGGGAEKREVRK